jgi:hypothetical protein
MSLCCCSSRAAVVIVIPCCCCCCRVLLSSFASHCRRSPHIVVMLRCSPCRCHRLTLSSCCAAVHVDVVASGYEGHSCGAAQRLQQPAAPLSIRGAAGPNV